jgi:predicted aconitase with swiveling domain
VGATGYTGSSGGGGGGAVTSVNSFTGDVDLDAGDVGAAATSHTHAAADTTTGTLSISRIPTGTSGTTVALGDHTHAGDEAAGITHVNSGLVTASNVTCENGILAALCLPLVIAAVAGDVLELSIECLVDEGGSDIVMDAATRVSGANARWFSTGTTTDPFPGGVPNWFCPQTSASNDFRGPRGSRCYTVQADDVVAGDVTVQPYGRGSGGSGTVLRSAAWPFQAVLKNLGPVAA